jgi:hypothetical protein
MELTTQVWAFRYANPRYSSASLRLAKTAPALVSRGSHGLPIGFNVLTHLPSISNFDRWCGFYGYPRP